MILMKLNKPALFKNNGHTNITTVKCANPKPLLFPKAIAVFNILSLPFQTICYTPGKFSPIFHHIQLFLENSEPSRSFLLRTIRLEFPTEDKKYIAFVLVGIVTVLLLFF